jgi:hypothetical protein
MIVRSSLGLPESNNFELWSTLLGICSSSLPSSQESKIAATAMTSGANQRLTFMRSQMYRRVAFLMACDLIFHLQPNYFAKHYF